jgi:hypothetical protein
MQGLESHRQQIPSATTPKQRHRENLEKQQTRKKPRKKQLRTEHNKHYRTLVVGFG